MLATAVRFGADYAVIDSNCTHYFWLTWFRVFGIRVVPVNIHADGAALAGLAGLAAAGKLTLRVADTYPLADAARAHERLQAGGVRGRLVLIP